MVFLFQCLSFTRQTLLIALCITACEELQVTPVRILDTIGLMDRTPVLFGLRDDLACTGNHAGRMSTFLCNVVDIY